MVAPSRSNGDFATTTSHNNNNNNKNNNKNDSENDNNLTMLDRTISIVLNDPDSTPSRKAGISHEMERLHRLHGISLILDASKLVSLRSSTYATACTIFHRFYHRLSLTEHDVWSVASAAVLLATKVEEEPHATLKTIIQVFCHLYRKRLLIMTTLRDDGVDCWLDHSSMGCLDIAKTLPLKEKEQRLAKLPLPMKLGPVYQQWHDQISAMEAIVLRQLGFTLYWIPDSHPHKFILYFCQVLDLTDPKFAQRAWNYCNDSCRLDLCVRYAAEVIASSSILLAARDFSIDLPVSPRPWFEVFIGTNKELQIATSANAIFGVCVKMMENHRKTESLSLSTSSSSLMAAASTGFVKSLVKDGSLTDPGSFLWEYHEDSFKEVEKEE